MAESPGHDRRARRRQETVAECLAHALDIMAEAGVGGLTISEVARRMGVKAPSLYKYFPSLHGLYDALYAMGTVANAQAVAAAVGPEPRGVPRIRAAARATVRWCVENQALAQLLYWRPVPGFEPSRSAFAASAAELDQARAELAEAVRLGQLHPRADSPEGLRLLMVQLSGLISQQLANEPAAAYDRGGYSSLTDEAVDMFVSHYRP